MPSRLLRLADIPAGSHRTTPPRSPGAHSALLTNRLMEGDTKELWGPETYGAFTSSGSAPSHQIHIGTQNPLLPTRDRPSALGRSTLEPFALRWGLRPRQRVPPAASLGFSDTASPSHPGTDFTHRQTQDARQVSAGENSVQRCEWSIRVISES